MRPALDTFGTLVYQSKADIYPGIDGIIEAVAVEEGQRVSSGQVLAVFSRDRLLTSREQIESEVASRQARLGLAEEQLREGRKAVEAGILEIHKAEAQLAQAEAEYENIAQVYSNKQRLFRAGGISEGELQALHTRFIAAEMELRRAEKELEIRRIGYRDQDILAAGLEVPEEEERRAEVLARINTGMLQAQLRVARAELGSARAELRRVEMMIADAVVSAPIDGIVGMRFVEVGEKADQDTLLFTLFNTEIVYAQIEAAETDLQRLRIGQDAELRFEGESQGRAVGRVELISPYINPKTRTARVRVGVDNTQGLYIPGMFVRVRIFTGQEQACVTIPFSAIISEAEHPAAGRAAVFLIRGSRCFRREVVLGQRQGDLVAVADGLEAGEELVLDPPGGLRDGTEVEVVR
ncbi:MAG: efflux RND transporter periplasmic adaptor subunit [Spirochaetales bacterium]|nr:efflux RND transporter periplasmic adaptor subunit [Spirochaetales bacterium]